MLPCHLGFCFRDFVAVYLAEITEANQLQGGSASNVQSRHHARESLATMLDGAPDMLSMSGQLRTMQVPRVPPNRFTASAMHRRLLIPLAVRRGNSTSWSVISCQCSGG